jgi:tRNA pseudouridine38-40 synthase
MILSQSAPMKRILVKVWYIGTDFFGSQEQTDKRTVEGELIKALISSSYITNRQDSLFRTAVRTDAGVHAIDAAFCFNSSQKFYPRKVESNLPHDMGIVSWVEVALDFHPRWKANYKEYRYIYPITQENQLDLNEMQKAMKILIGTHDFRLFSKTNRNKPEQKTILSLEKAILTQHVDYLSFEFGCRAFLWEMIRRLVSFLIQIGKNKKSLEDLNNRFAQDYIVNSNDKRDSPVSSNGLTLRKIDFESELDFIHNEKGIHHRREFLKKLINQTKQNLFSFDHFHSDLIDFNSKY